MQNLRIGLIIPANNVVIEPEYYSIGLSQVTFHSQRLIVQGDSRKELLAMLGGIDSAARIISVSRPSVIAYCCLSSSFILGIGWDKKLANKIEKQSNVPTVTAATSMLDALRELGMREIVTVSAYGRSINSTMTRFLRDNGISVVRSLALDLRMNEVGNQGVALTYRRAKQIFTEKADGLFIGSTDLKSMCIIEKLERELDRPVVTVNQALLKYAMKRIGRSISISGYGRLLRSK